MDIVGPLPKGKRGVKFILVLTDYFTKWIEAKALAKVKQKDVIDFVKKNVIYWFGVPREIACDNGPQFIGSIITDFFKQ